jgi:hypothetical protein
VHKILVGILIFHLLGVSPASDAAPISLYRGNTLLSRFGEQEQSKRVRRRRGIKLADKLSKE